MDDKTKISKRWSLVVLLTATALTVSYIVYKKVRNNVVESAQSVENGRFEAPKNGISSKQTGKYEGLLVDIVPTAEEESERPPNIAEASWRATLFFHRQNTQENNGPVEFYGKIVDQQGMPVVGANVFAYSSYYVESIREQIEYGGGKKARKEVQVKTDEDGRFVIQGYRAINLKFTKLEKPGYRAKEQFPGGLIFGNGFSSKFQPDKHNPMLFHMWKTGDTEPLVKAKWQKSLVPDGGKYTMDLATGKDDGGGGLTVSIQANYDKIPDMNQYSWTSEVSSPGGGVMESNDPFPFEAPDGKYIEKLAWEVKEGEGWANEIKRSFYVRLKDGKSAVVYLRIKLYHTNSARIFVDLLLNPSGSRNLEYDPEKEISAPSR